MISIVVPAFNEAEFLGHSVRQVVAGLRARGHHAEVLVVENGSADATAEIARELAEELPEVVAVSLERADYGGALRRGVLQSSGDVVVFFDVDYYDLGFLDTAVAALRSDGGPAMVLASKRAAGSDDRRSWARRLITAGFAAVLRVGFGLRVSDTHGMKALRRAAVLPVVETCRFGSDLFDTELVLRAERAGLEVTEVPVTVEESRPSRSSILLRGLRAVTGLGRLRLALWRERG